MTGRSLDAPGLTIPLPYEHLLATMTPDNLVAEVMYWKNRCKDLDAVVNQYIAEVKELERRMYNSKEICGC